LRKIAPLNILEEKKKFIKSAGEYVPQFTYAAITLDLDMYKKQLKSIEIPDIPLAGIYERKKQEVLNKIHFLQAFEKKDNKQQTKYSHKLFGKVLKHNLERCEKVFSNK
jgi:hypothetical protein